MDHPSHSNFATHVIKIHKTKKIKIKLQTKSKQTKQKNINISNKIQKIVAKCEPKKGRTYLGIDVINNLEWKLPSIKLQNFLPHNPTL